MGFTVSYFSTVTGTVNKIQPGEEQIVRHLSILSMPPVLLLFLLINRTVGSRGRLLQTHKIH
jgi:hypothetical protein